MYCTDKSDSDTAWEYRNPCIVDTDNGVKKGLVLSMYRQIHYVRRRHFVVKEIHFPEYVKS